MSQARLSPTSEVIAPTPTGRARSHALPAEASPIWLEGVVISDFENDTLPLLFANDETFRGYYDAMCSKNEKLSEAIKHLHDKNAEARKERKIDLQSCLSLLWHCIHLRQRIFYFSERKQQGHPQSSAEEYADFQYSAAVNHFLLTLLKLATDVLHENGNADTSAIPFPKNRESRQALAFELFKKAQEAESVVVRKSHQWFFKALIQNNFADYFFQRGKCMAASQCALDSLKAIRRSHVTTFIFYFYVRAGTSEILAGRFDDALESLQMALRFIFSLRDYKMDTDTAVRDSTTSLGEAVPPIRFSIEVPNITLPLLSACEVVACHNMAIAQIGRRKYRTALLWSNRALAAVTAYQLESQPGCAEWLSIVFAARAYCQKIVLSPVIDKVKVPPGSAAQQDINALTKALLEVTNTADFQALLRVLDTVHAENIEQQRVELLQQLQQARRAGASGFSPAPSTPSSTSMRGRTRHQKLPNDQVPKMARMKGLPIAPRPGLVGLTAFLKLSPRTVEDGITGSTKVPPLITAVYGDGAAPLPKKKRAKKSQTRPGYSSDESPSPPQSPLRITEAAARPSSSSGNTSSSSAAEPVDSPLARPLPVDAESVAASPEPTLDPAMPPPSSAPDHDIPTSNDIEGDGPPVEATVEPMKENEEPKVATSWAEPSASPPGSPTKEATEDNPQTQYGQEGLEPSSPEGGKTEVTAESPSKEQDETISLDGLPQFKIPPDAQWKPRETVESPSTAPMVDPTPSPMPQSPECPPQPLEGQTAPTAPEGADATGESNANGTGSGNASPKAPALDPEQLQHSPEDSGDENEKQGDEPPKDTKGEDSTQDAPKTEEPTETSSPVTTAEPTEAAPTAPAPAEPEPEPSGDAKPQDQGPENTEPTQSEPLEPAPAPVPTTPPKSIEKSLDKSGSVLGSFSVTESARGRQARINEMEANALRYDDKDWSDSETGSVRRPDTSHSSQHSESPEPGANQGSPDSKPSTPTAGAGTSSAPVSPIANQQDTSVVLEHADDTKPNEAEPASAPASPTAVQENSVQEDSVLTSNGSVEDPDNASSIAPTSPIAASPEKEEENDEPQPAVAAAPPVEEPAPAAPAPNNDDSVVSETEAPAPEPTPEPSAPPQAEEEKPKDPPKPEVKPEIPTCLRIKIVSGANLIPQDLRTSDPFVEICWGEQPSGLKTKVKNSTLSPTWDEQFHIEVPLNITYLALRMFDHDSFAKNDFMGQARLDTVQRTAKGQFTLPLNPRPENPEDQKLLTKHKAGFGTLTISVDWLANGNGIADFHEAPADLASTATSSAPPPKPVATSDQTDDSDKKPTPQPLGKVPLCLHLKIISGAKLIPQDLRSSDPYVEIFWLNDRPTGCKTKVKNSTLDPVWNEDFFIEVPASHTQLTLLMFDYDTFGKSDFMGQAQIECKDRSASGQQYTFPLNPRPGNAEDQKLMAKHKGGLGSLTVSLEWLANSNGIENVCKAPMDMLLSSYSSFAPSASSANHASKAEPLIQSTSSVATSEHAADDRPARASVNYTDLSPSISPASSRGASPTRLRSRSPSPPPESSPERDSDI